MCVISKNYLLYVKRQIHGWREFFLTHKTHTQINLLYSFFTLQREREGLTNNDDAQTKTNVEEEVLPEAWA